MNKFEKGLTFIFSDVVLLLEIVAYKLKHLCVLCGPYLAKYREVYSCPVC